MNKIVKAMIDLSDLQKEIHDRVIIKFPKVDTKGGFCDLIVSTNIKLIGSKALYAPKNISFEKAIDNLLYNLKKLDVKVIFKGYDDLAHRISSIKQNVEALGAMDVLLECSDKYHQFLDKDSFEYRLIDLKFFYDNLMHIEIEERHKWFNDYYSKFNIKED